MTDNRDEPDPRAERLNQRLERYGRRRKPRQASRAVLGAEGAVVNPLDETLEALQHSLDDTIRKGILPLVLREQLGWADLPEVMAACIRQNVAKVAGVHREQEHSDRLLRPYKSRQRSFWLARSGKLMAGPGAGKLMAGPGAEDLADVMAHQGRVAEVPPAQVLGQVFRAFDFIVRIVGAPVVGRGRLSWAELETVLVSYSEQAVADARRHWTAHSEST